MSTAVIVAATLLIAAIWEELSRDPVIIEPLLVPDSAVKAGWTGEVLARQIRDRVREIHRKASTMHRRDEYWFEREQMDVVLPGGLISIGMLATVIRGIIDRPSRRISAEVAEVDVPAGSAACVSNSSSSRRYLLVARLHPYDRSWTVCKESLADLPGETAEAVVQATSQYILASYLHETDPDRARSMAEAILRDRSRPADHPWALNLIGIINFDGKEYEAAITNYQEALRLDPNFASAYNNWGMALSDLKRPEEAIVKYEQATRLDPNFVHAYNGWGSALGDLKRPEEAIVKYEQATRLDPNFVHAYNGWGSALGDLKRPEEAIVKYEQATRLDPNYVNAYNNWGMALRDLKRPEEAIVKYEQATRLDPNFVHAYNGWGNALGDLKRPEEAIVKYEQATRLDPAYANAYWNWAIELDNLGRPEEAKVKRAIYTCLNDGGPLESCASAEGSIMTGAGSSAGRR